MYYLQNVSTRVIILILLLSTMITFILILDYCSHFTQIASAYYINEPVHEISNNVVCATSKASDQPAHTRSLIRGFASRLSIL